ncbi:MAG TPA: hypothetical protein DCZ94_17390 [Lentisphaeria bacterium]|nr:MAG: hypothetical protein A2X48_20790 [Lentisphaerae bacterium GWF2_49_21]HBC88718.1 hypothetical protein [Lentisphaeria bacterium]
MDNILNSSINDSVPPFQVRTSGMVRNMPYHSTPGTKEGDIMLTVFLGGQGFYHSAGRIQKIRRGMVGLVGPGNPGLLIADPKNPYTHLYCRFRGGYAVVLAGRILEKRKSRFFEYDKFAKLAETLKKMGHMNRSELPTEMGRRELLLSEALLMLDGKLEDTVQKNISTSTLRYYLEEGISKPTDLAEMAEYFSVSKATLCRQSRKCLGTTIQKYHEQIKMDWAKELLKLGLFPIKDVAMKLGYSDPLYFSRVFKDYSGKSPSEWMEDSSSS